MTWTTTDDLEAFLAVADDYLSARPDRHTLLLSAIASHRSTDHRYAAEHAPLYGWWREASWERRLAGVFVWTPPHLIAISPMPGEAASRLAPVIAAQRRATTGVVGPGPTVHELVDAWFRHTGSRAYARRDTRLYRLGRLTWPKPPVPGRSRPATAGDRGLLTEWCEAFARETGERLADSATLVDERLTYGGWTLWEAEGEPVSLAGITRATSGMARITPVYTPPDRRRRGYAGAVVAAISRQALDTGVKHVLLFADLADPTSGALYQRLGFERIEDHTIMGFEARAEAGATGRERSQ